MPDAQTVPGSTTTDAPPGLFAPSKRAAHLADASTILPEPGASAFPQTREYLRQAYADNARAKFLSAREAGYLAVSGFRQCGDALAESRALCTLAHAQASLGYAQAAEESALLALQLAPPDSLALAKAYCQLGEVYLLDERFTLATAALDHARELLTPEYGHILGLTRKRRWLETVKAASLRYHSGSPPDIAPLRRIRAEHLRACAGPPGAIDGSATDACAGVLDALEHCWASELDEARVDLETTVSRTRRKGARAVLTPLCHWVRTELAWAHQDWDLAESSARQLVTSSERLNHALLTKVGGQILAQLHTLQGQFLPAYSWLKTLEAGEWARRDTAPVEGGSRVSLQLELRATRQALQTLRAQTQQLQQWSLEDPLTGLPNRRHLEARLPEMLKEGAADGVLPLVAMLDIDNFKSINDTYSHEVGDRVLQHIGVALKAFVRAQDLCARLSGDEFVIAFAAITPEDAKQVTGRIQEAMSRCNWHSVHPGLKVTVSVGLARALTTDSLDTLLHRSDLAMYQSKAAARTGRVERRRVTQSPAQEASPSPAQAS